MSTVIRRTLVTILIPIALAACRDSVQPSSIIDRRSASLATMAADSDSPRHLIIFEELETPTELLERVRAAGGDVLGTLDGVGVAVARGLSEAAVAELRLASGIRGIEPDLVVGHRTQDDHGDAVEAAADATDVIALALASPTSAKFYPRQWNLRAIGADVAWALGYRGSPEVTAAILDTGIDYLHPDLMGRVDLTRSISLLSDPVSDPSAEDALVRSMFPGRNVISDLHSHGTAVSALIASNGVVLAGVTQQTTLIAVKVHDRTRRNRISAYLKGIIYAADNGADVIHLSIPLEFDKHVSPGLVASVQRTLGYAHRKGAVMVAAAGNAALTGDGDLDRDVDRFRFCNGVHVICVSATGPTSAGGLNGPWTDVDAVAPYTNFGRSSIDVAGPGGTGAAPRPTTVWLVCSQTTIVGGNPAPCRAGQLLWSSTGTSFGAAATSGLAALLVSTIGKNQPEKIRSALEGSADDLGSPGTDPYYGKGRINVAQAVRMP